MINQLRELCQFHGIPPQCTGFDETGGGVVFGQWLRSNWSHAVKGVKFGEKPTDRRPDSTNESTVYKNRVTQLWVQPKAMVRQGQIRGIPQDVVDELCQRKWHPRNHTGKVTCVEEKKDMKKRTGKSPDLGDTFCILVEVALENGFLDTVEIKRTDKRMQKMWKDRVHGMMGDPDVPRKSLVAMPTVKRLKFRRT